MTIRSLLVANRGEIARRIFRTATSMGIKGIAVYADADARSPFVREADESVRLLDGYLDGDAIVAAALASGADAIHPGYGFMAENAGFARAVGDAGLTWVGPAPGVIEAMGDKIAAKQAALDAGVPTLPSSDDPEDGCEIGFPLLVKAAAGGGGKGMRLVEEPVDLAEAVAGARREAMGGFGDDRVFLERYVARSRHVEIQILGDSHGGLVHLGERECSIQRRHQKIIEESPSPAVAEELRAAMGDAALALARSLGYESAGTVEFIVDDATHEFWFLEVNTRLQVEHPVTEEVTGIDLVREQLRIASGEPLGYGQADICFSGHAVEARLYAEDPQAGFLPSTGTIVAFEPRAGLDVRWDSGVDVGSEIGVDFDPMLAKVIAHAPTRAEAAGRLALALEGLHLGGVTTNRDFLTATLRSPAFLAGATTTDFIDRVAPDRVRELGDDQLARIRVSAALWIQGANRAAATTQRAAPSGWRNAPLPAEWVELAHRDTSAIVHYRRRRDGSFSIGPDGEDGVAMVHRWSPDLIDVEWAGTRSSHRISRVGDRVYLTGGGGTTTFTVVPRFEPPGTEITTGALVAPMPGSVIDVRVAVGDPVGAGQVLVVIEAMKMEHHVRAAADGLVTQVHVEKGQQVENGALLLVIEKPGATVEGSDADSRSVAET
jgi:propionyl-CoA carboxylase alpha chain